MLADSPISFGPSSIGHLIEHAGDERQLKHFSYIPDQRGTNAVMIIMKKVGYVLSFAFCIIVLILTVSIKHNDILLNN